ncbi:hypothetical protein V6N11_064886 [Hibiscus sabdariffa]
MTNKKDLRGGIGSQFDVLREVNKVTSQGSIESVEVDIALKPMALVVVYEFYVDVEFEAQNVSNQFVHGRVKVVGSYLWLNLTTVYASHGVMKHKLIRRHLATLNLGPIVSWLLREISTPSYVLV